MQGRDLMAEESPPESVLIQCAHQAPMDGIGVRPNVHSLRDARYRISVFEGLRWGELYDLENDPAELCNLWDDPAPPPRRPACSNGSCGPSWPMPRPRPQRSPVPEPASVPGARRLGRAANRAATQ